MHALKDMPAIETNGLSYLCFISNNTYDTLPKIGNEVSLNTYFHVNESSQQLFGFKNISEKDLFESLRTFFVILGKYFSCSLDAISGTTPPYSL